MRNRLREYRHPSANCVRSRHKTPNAVSQYPVGLGTRTRRPQLGFVCVGRPSSSQAGTFLTSILSLGDELWSGMLGSPWVNGCWCVPLPSTNCCNYIIYTNLCEWSIVRNDCAKSHSPLLSVQQWTNTLGPTGAGGGVDDEASKRAIRVLGTWCGHRRSLRRNWGATGSKDERERRRDKGRLGGKDPTSVPFLLF